MQISRFGMKVADPGPGPSELSSNETDPDVGVDVIQVTVGTDSYFARGLSDVLAGAMSDGAGLRLRRNHP